MKHNPVFDIPVPMINDCIACISRGSIIYGTWHKKSDVDMYCIMPDNYDFSGILPCDKFGECHAEFRLPKNIYFDIQFLHESEYIQGLNDGNIAFLELIWQTESLFDIRYKEFHERFDNAFILNKWNVRKWTSSQCNNSWAKCHKKMTIEVDNYRWTGQVPKELMYIGRKSLWHVFRLYDYAIQILSNGKITNYMPDNIIKLYKQIVKKNDDWITLKQKYQSLKNEYATRMRTLVDKEK